MHTLALIFDGSDGPQFTDALSGTLITYAYIIGGYHIVLLLTVLFKNKEKGLSLPLGSTLITHLACLVLVVSIAVGRHYIPFFSLIKYFIPGIAPFEANWLFSGGKQQARSILGAERVETVHVAEPASDANADEYEEFLKLLHLNIRPHRRPGSSLKDEFERWRAARAKTDAKARASNPTT